MCPHCGKPSEEVKKISLNQYLNHFLSLIRMEEKMAQEQKLAEEKKSTDESEAKTEEKSDA